MRSLKFCLVFPLFGMFVCVLVWLYLQTQLVEDVQIEPPLVLNRPSQSDWDLFLARRRAEMPPLSESITPWSKIDKGENSTDWQVQIPMVELPSLSSNSNVSCILRKFGFTRSQASEVYNSNRKLRSCGDGSSHFIQIANNKLTIDCGGMRWSEYVVGQDPSEELLGDVEFPRNWAQYNGPIDIGNTEFVFARCGKTKREALLTNRFNETIAEAARNTTERLRRELGIKEKIKPLTVYLLMFDSLSRLHFYRNFPETVEYLNKTLGPEGDLSGSYSLFDFAVNNAHGENTQPNMVPFLFGYDIKYHKMRLQDYSIHHPDDVWKYAELQEEVLWTHFRKHGFVTLFGYDTVWDSFSHSFGRVIKTDHMVSNFYHASKRLAGYMDFQDKERCVGTQNAHNYALNYITQFNANYKGYSRFAYQHISTGHDKSGIVIRTADSDTKRFLEKLLEEQLSHPDEDFVLFIASDHGKHSNEWDRTYEGFLENQLPLHLMITNTDLVRKLGAREILKHNTKRLVTRLDWHVTFRHLATVPFGKLSPQSPLYTAWKQQTDSEKSISLLLEKVPDERDCEDLTIPLHYCSCKEFIDISKEEAQKMPVIHSLVQLGLHYINSVIALDKAQDICAMLSFGEMIKAGFQLVGNEQSITRNFKIRIATKENRNTKFDFIGLMVAEENAEMLRSDGAVVNSTFVTTTEDRVLLQLVDIFRVDDYAGICEQLAITISTKAAFCVCRIPLPEGSLTPSQSTAVEKLMGKVQMALARRGRNCHLTCIDLGKSCHPWAVQLINDERVILQPWTNSTRGVEFVYMSNGESGSMKELAITEWKRDGKVIKLHEENGGKWSGILASKDPSCDDQPKSDFAICPCN